jgi:hypothetical protein
MIDFTRAFRTSRRLEDPKKLLRCCRELWEKLRQLDKAEVLEKTRPYLTKSEVKALMARRDMILAYFDQLIVEKGEDRVLY